MTNDQMHVSSSPMSPSKSPIMIVGTDTDIGKTIFAAGLVGMLNANYWKPIQSGIEDETDTEIVARLSGVGSEKILPEGYRLNQSLSPHRSAELDGIEIDVNALTIPDIDGPLIIEGAGGLMVPMNRKTLLIDQVARWKVPVILCARTGLGTINHTLLSLEALRARDIPILGVAFIGDDIPDTIRTIGEMGQVRILGRLPVIEPLTPEAVEAAFSEHFSADAFQMEA